MGKTRDLFKKIRDTKGTFHAKMGTIKDRNGMDLIETKEIKKRWQQSTEELYKNDLHDPENHSGIITHIEPDILECDWSSDVCSSDLRARRDKVFLSDQWKEIEENNRMGKTRDLFKKIRDTKGTYTKKGSIKDRNGKD